MPSWRSANPISPGSRACLRDLGDARSMKIIDIQWRTYRLPFLHSFSTAHSVMTTREGIIVQVTTSRGGERMSREWGAYVERSRHSDAGGEGTQWNRYSDAGGEGISGFGEIAPLPTFAGGSLADAHALLPALAARLRHKTLREALDLLYATEGEGYRKGKALQRPPPPFADWKSRCLMRLAKQKVAQSLRCSLQPVQCHEQPCRSMPLSALEQRRQQSQPH